MLIDLRPVPRQVRARVELHLDGGPGARSAIYWKAAMNQSAILYEDRFTKPTVA